MIRINLLATVCLWLMLHTEKSETFALSETTRVFFEQDSTFIHQKDFQLEVDNLEKVGYFDIENENLNLGNLLDNKNDVIKYVNFLISMKYPDVTISNINVEEDRTKKLWFVCTPVVGAYFEKHIHIIIIKKNCKVVVFRMTH